MLIRGSLSIVLIISCLTLFSQTSEFNMDKKHVVKVTLSTETGSIDIPEKYVENSDSLYFILEPKGDWEFSKGDKKDLMAIKFKKEDGAMIDIARSYGLYNGSSKISKILIVFPKAGIDLTRYFELHYEANKTSAMEFPEKHWPKYVEFNEYYNRGRELNDERQYIEAYQQLEYMLPGSDYFLEFSRFSLHPQIEENLIPEVLENYQQRVEQEYAVIQRTFDESEEVSLQELTIFGLKKDSVIMTKTTFDAYYRMSEPKSIEMREKHEKIATNYQNYYNGMYDKWKTTALSVIETGYYQSENKYELFIGLLTRMLVYTERVEILTPYDSINTNLLTDPTLDISFFRYHMDLIKLMNWKEEFLIVVQLLNDEIKTRKQILGVAHMNNLRANKRTEKQPNYDIINAFNDLVKGNFDLFENNIQNAIKKSTDKEIIYYLELWNASNRLRMKSASQEFVDNVNAGLDFERKMLPNDAIEKYKMAKRLDSKNALAPFLIGRTMLEDQNQPFASERYFNEAVNLYPQFALARIYHLELKISNKQFTEALVDIQAITNYPDLQIWYIYYLKAQVLYLQGQYKQALNVIETDCVPINSNTFNQHILLGEIYLNLKDCAKSKEHFESAGELDPTNPVFSEKMRIFVQTCNN